ncbi:MAG: DUF3857 domain-containing transglutaminase family protein, partial [Pseudomonadota bacterium]
LFDTQIKTEKDHYDFYRRAAMLILSEGGLEEAGQFTMAFDPEKEDVTLHDVTIWREGVPVSRLDQLNLEVARQEQQLQDGIADGYLTLFAEIPDVKVGDIVDWSATWTIRSPGWPGHFYYNFHTEWYVPSAHDHTRILTPAGSPLTVTPRGDALAPHFSQKGAWDERVWQAKNIPARHHHHHVPVDVFQYAGVSVSTMQTWQDIANWGVDIYAPTDHLPTDIKTVLTSVQSRPLAEQITWAIRFVQDDIRYFSNSVGLGAHIPRDPATTLRLGYGDCKDKSVLLVSLLKALGVEATVALTHLDNGASLPALAPSPLTFNHAIVRITTDHGPVFIDPTSRLQGGVFPFIHTPAYGYVLPLVEGATLEKMPMDVLEHPTIEVAEDFDFTDALTQGIRLKVTTSRQGVDADRFRNQLATTPLSAFERTYHSYYQEMYPGIEIASALQGQDQRDHNHYQVTEHYLIPAAKVTAEFLAQFPFDAEGARFSFPTDIETGRPYDIAIGHPNDGQHTITARGITHLVTKGQDYEHQTGPLLLSIKTAIEGDLVRMDHRVRTSSDRVLQAEVNTYKQDYDAFRKALSFTVDLSGITPQTVQVPPQASINMPTLSEAPPSNSFSAGVNWIYNGVSLLIAILMGALIGIVTARRRQKR